MTLYEKRAANGFYDVWESKTSQERDVEMRLKLKEYLQLAARLPFYESRLSQVDLQSTHPLLKVPVLLAEEVRGLVPPQSKQLLTVSDSNYTVFQSGGTTGTPKSTLFSNAELDGLDLPNARGFYALGLKTEDRVGNLFAVGSLYMTFVHINRMLQQYGCMNFPFSNHTNAEFVHTVVKLFNVNVLTGISSVVLNAMRAMHDIDATGIKIEKVFYGGEHLYEADKREIREKFGTEVIAAPGYGTVDTWYIGYQCLQCPTGVFHAHDDQVYLEVVNEETGRHVEVGEVGMLYATAFPRRVTPIVRYRVGDNVRWLKDSCKCGRTTPLFQLIGRGDDVLRIGYDSVDYNAIQDCVLKVPHLSGTIQMEKQREQGRDRIVIRVETDARDEVLPSLTKHLENEILASRPSLSEFIKKGTVWPLVIQLVRPGSLPRNQRTGKLMRVIDSKLE